MHQLMKFKAIFIAAIIFSFQCFADCETDLSTINRRVYTLGQGLQADLEKRNLRVGTYNALDLMVSSKKPAEDCRRIGMQILQNNPDLIFLQEVNGMRDFSRDYLNDNYRAFEFSNNDPKHKKIALLVRTDVSAEASFANIMDGFQRSVPVAVFRFAEGNPVIFMGVHLKSKKVRKNEDMDALRQRDIDNFINLVGRVRQEFGSDARIVAMGDFNGQLHNEANMLDLIERSQLIDTLDLFKMSEDDRATHVYFSGDGRRIVQQMDGILVSRSVLGAIRDARVLPPLTLDGKEMPLPMTLEEQFTNPSDHRLVFTDFDLHHLIFSNP